MASSGSMNTGSVEGMYLEFSWSIKSQSIAENKTTINWKLTSKRNDANTTRYVYCGNYQVKIDGQILFSKPSSYREPLYHNQTVASGTHTMSHNSAGEKSFPAYIHAGIYEYAVNASASKTFTLNTIPRKATIHSLMDFNDETTNIVFGFKNPGNFTINIGIEKWVNSSIVLNFRRNNVPNTKDANGVTWYNFQMTDTERNSLRNYMKDLKSMSIRLVIETQLPSGNDWSYEEKTVSIVNANPTFTGFSVKDINTSTVAITKNNLNILEGQSDVQVTVQGATGVKGATIKSYVVMQGNTTQSSTSSTVTLGKAIGENPIKVRIVDSRGNIKEISKTLKYSGGNINLIRYRNPGITSAYTSRANGGTDTLSHLNFISRVAYVCGANNTVITKYRIKESTAQNYGSWVTVTPSISYENTDSIITVSTSLGHRDINKTFNVEVNISDGLKTDSVVVNLDTASVLLSLRKGMIGVNKIPIIGQGALQVAGDVTIYGRTIDTAPGTIIAWTGAVDKIPAGYLLAEGQAISRSTYSALFQKIGTIHGSGDNTSTFNLPNMKGRTFVSQNTTGVFTTLGKVGGSESYSLSLAQMPEHNHTGTTSSAGAHTHAGRIKKTDGHYVGTSATEVRRIGDNSADTYDGTITRSSGAHTHTMTTSTQGSGATVWNIQPYLVGKYLIKY